MNENVLKITSTFAVQAIKLLKIKGYVLKKKKTLDLKNSLWTEAKLNSRFVQRTFLSSLHVASENKST